MSSNGNTKTTTAPENFEEKEFLLGEYEALRAEQLHNFRSVNQLHALQITATRAFLGVAFSITPLNSYIFLLPILFLIPIAYRLLNYALAILRIGTYIEVFIEPKFASFGWEHRVEDFRSSRKLNNKPSIFLKVKSAVQDYTILTSWVIIVICPSLSYIYWTDELWYLVVIIALSGTTLIPVSYRLSRLGKIRSEFKERWNRLGDQT